MLLNDKLKARRIELKLTMAEVAKLVGVSEATISRWESGDISNMRRDKIALYAKALNTTPLFVMGLDKAPNDPNQEKHPKVTLTQRQNKIINLFSELTEAQQDNLIGRAELFVEQNEQEKKQKQKSNNQTHMVYKIARSNNGEQAGFVEVSQEEFDRLENAPETDEDFS